MRVFRDLEMVEQMGSGIQRILQIYPTSIYQFTSNFIRVVLPFAQLNKQATPQAEKVLAFCIEPKSRSEIQQHLGLKDREYFRKAILKPLLEAGLLQYTIPDKPSSPKQQFITVINVGGESR